MLLTHKQEVIDLILEETQDYRDAVPLKEPPKETKAKAKNKRNSANMDGTKNTLHASTSQQVSGGGNAMYEGPGTPTKGEQSAARPALALPSASSMGLSQANNLPTRLEDPRSPPHSQFGTPQQVVSPHGSMRSPSKLPPMGVFNVTSSPDRMRDGLHGRTSESGSPSRR